MNKIPCKQCGQTKGETFHTMEEAVNRYREDAKKQYRKGNFDHADYLMQYMEDMKADCIRSGYDFHPFEPLTNLEYLEFKVAEKEDKPYYLRFINQPDCTLLPEDWK